MGGDNVKGQRPEGSTSRPAQFAEGQGTYYSPAKQLGMHWRHGECGLILSATSQWDHWQLPAYTNRRVSGIRGARAASAPHKPVWVDPGMGSDDTPHAF